MKKFISILKKGCNISLCAAFFTSYNLNFNSGKECSNAPPYLGLCKIYNINIENI